MTPYGSKWKRMRPDGIAARAQRGRGVAKPLRPDEPNNLMRAETHAACHLVVLSPSLGSPGGRFPSRRINRTHLAGNVDRTALGLLSEGDDTGDVRVTLENSDSLMFEVLCAREALSRWMDWGLQPNGRHKRQ